MCVCVCMCDLYTYLYLNLLNKLIETMVNKAANQNYPGMF